MKIVIAGSGETGTHLAKMLSLENQDVTLMSSDKVYLSGLDSTYNLMVAVGDPTSARDLSFNGADTADLFVAVTPNESENIIAASLARHLGAKGSIARVSKEEFILPRLKQYFYSLGIDSTVYPESLVAEDISQFLKRSWVTSWFELCDGQLLLAGVRIASRAPVADRPLREIARDHLHFHVSAVRRGHRIIIPGGDDVLREGDVAYFSFKPDFSEMLARLTGQEPVKVRNIMIIGAGPITRMLIDKLDRSHNITVISTDPAECDAIKAFASHATVVNTSAKDIQTLENEGLDQMDAFIALESDAESNIVSCMMAREYGVKKTIAQIEDIQYMAESERLWIDKVVNKKLITSATILRHIMGKAISIKSVIALQDAEVAEIDIPEGSKVTRKSIRELEIPKGMTIGGIIRYGEGILVSGDTRLMQGDRIMVFFLPGMLEKVVKFFRKIC